MKANQITEDRADVTWDPTCARPLPGSTNPWTSLKNLRRMNAQPRLSQLRIFSTSSHQSKISGGRMAFQHWSAMPRRFQQLCLNHWPQDPSKVPKDGACPRRTRLQSITLTTRNMANHTLCILGMFGLRSPRPARLGLYRRLEVLAVMTGFI